MLSFNSWKKNCNVFFCFFLNATPASLFLHWEFSKWGSRLMDHMMSKSVTKTLVGRTHGWRESRQRPGMIFETRFLFILPAVFNFCTKRSCKRKFEILKSNHSSIEFLWCENANTDPVGGCRKQRCIYTVTWFSLWTQEALPEYVPELNMQRSKRCVASSQAISDNAVIINIHHEIVYLNNVYMSNIPSHNRICHEKNRAISYLSRHMLLCRYINFEVNRPCSRFFCAAFQEGDIRQMSWLSNCESWHGRFALLL